LAPKVKKIRYFFLVFTFSFLAGSAYYLFEYFGVLSLRGYVLDAPNADVEKRFWELLPADCIRYWPVFVYKSSQIRTLMEKTVPVQVSTEAKGIGLFHTRISYLEPWLMVEWRRNTWYLSKEGYMWAPEINAFKIPESPLWKVSESLNRYSEVGEHAPDGVFHAMFSIDELKRFDDIFRVQSWYADTEYISINRRAGEFIMELSINQKGKKVVLIVNGAESKLREIDTLLKHVLAQIIPDGKEVIIDMSYTDKIVVTRGA
jgi:hypothetical protein